MRGISIKVIVLATLAVFGIDFVSGTVLMGAFGVPLSASPEVARAAIEALNRNSHYLVAVLLLGTASTVVGGYLTARLSQRVPYFNALAFGVVGVLLGVPASQSLPLWLIVVGLGVTIPAALLGAYLARRSA